MFVWGIDEQWRLLASQKQGGTQRKDVGLGKGRREVSSRGREAV